MMFNTLKYAKILEDVGFSRDQAETSIKILVEIMEDRLASKDDLKELKTEMKELKTEMERGFSRLETNIQHSVSQVESKLTIKMGTMLAASIAILTAIQKFI